MTRNEMIRQLQNVTSFDVAIIGGGATGLGIAVDAASRGYKTILFEKNDFGKGTSSRSTKLIHGGVRYLQQGNIKLVLEALHERGILKRNAPHLFKTQSFIVPNYSWWEKAYYGLGLKIYDWMSGSLSLGASEVLSKEDVLQFAPGIKRQNLRGGILYYDGQFDDARLAINLAQTATDHHAVVLNYFEVVNLLKSGNKITGLTVKDVISKNEYQVNSIAVINATGVFTDFIQQMDDTTKHSSITSSQGIHIVIDKEFLPGDKAIMIPHTEDGRVLFAVPWHEKVIIGTTDTPVQNISDEPVALAEEIKYLVRHIGKYLEKPIQLTDIKSVFAGLRPLVKRRSKRTAELSRDHTIIISDSGLVSILGGKWTTYRKMAEDTLNIAIKNAGLRKSESTTTHLAIHGGNGIEADHSPDYYGTDREEIKNLEQSNPEMSEKIHPLFPYTKGEILWAVKKEFCISVEDALARRTRALFLNSAAAIEAAPVVAKLIADETSQNGQWIKQQIDSFHQLAKKYQASEILKI